MPLENGGWGEEKKRWIARMGGEITVLQAYLRNADRVEMVHIATTGRLDPKSRCPCV